MKNKLVSIENITFLVIILIGILIGLLVYQNNIIVGSKTAPDLIVVKPKNEDNSIESNSSTEHLSGDLTENDDSPVVKPTDNAENSTRELSESVKEQSLTKSEHSINNKESDAVSIEIPEIPSPKFDLFSVDKFGSATIAGKGLAGESLEIILDGEVVSKVIPDNNGNFATILDIGTSDNPRSLKLKTLHSDGRAVTSEETVLITPILEDVNEEEIQTSNLISNSQTLGSEANEGLGSSTAPANLSSDLSKDVKSSDVSIAIVSSKEIKVISPALQRDAPKVLDVIIDAISYDEEGEVFLTGRGVEDQHIRIYVDNKPIKTSSIKADGTWSLDLEEIDAGVYILRIDQLDSDGVVTSRTETPFQKETADVAKKMASLEESSDGISSPKIGIGLSTVIIQPGYTLWAVAKKTYGLGMQYVRIYHANKDQIRDPDLIYPGQIFKLPE